MIKTLLLGLSVIAVACAGAALAQQGGIKRTPLQKVDFPPGYTTVTAIAEVPAGGSSGRHSHPGVETGYVMEGELHLLIDGKPERAPWIDLADLKRHGAVIVWDGGSDTVPPPYAAFATGAQVQPPLTLPWRWGRGENTFGWAIVPPQKP